MKRLDTSVLRPQVRNLLIRILKIPNDGSRIPYVPPYEFTSDHLDPIPYKHVSSNMEHHSSLKISMRDVPIYDSDITQEVLEKLRGDMKKATPRSFTAVFDMVRLAHPHCSRPMRPIDVCRMSVGG